MKPCFAVLLVLLACSAAKAEVPVKVPFGGFSEYSLYDFSAEELEDFSGAMRARSIAERRGKTFVQPARATTAQVEARIAELRRLQSQPQQIANADLLSELVQLKNRPKSDAPYLLQPPNLAITTSCKVLSTRQSGVKRKDGYTGYGRYFKCPDGDVFVADMLLIGMRMGYIREQANVEMDGVPGTLLIFEDSLGARHYRLAWISANTHHIVSKQGYGRYIEDWLLRYASQVIAAERAL